MMSSFIRMTAVLLLTVLGVGSAFPAFSGAFLSNPAVNGAILGLLAIGVVYVYHTVWQISKEARWMDKFRSRTQGPMRPPGQAPGGQTGEPHVRPASGRPTRPVFAVRSSGPEATTFGAYWLHCGHPHRTHRA